MHVSYTGYSKSQIIQFNLDLVIFFYLNLLILIMFNWFLLMMYSRCQQIFKFSIYFHLFTILLFEIKLYKGLINLNNSHVIRIFLLHYFLLTFPTYSLDFYQFYIFKYFKSFNTILIQHELYQEGFNSFINHY